MRHYQYRFPPGLILPGILGMLLLAVVVSVGLLLFGIVLAALVAIGIGSAIYRSLFGSKREQKRSRHQSIRIRTKRSTQLNEIPFSDYTEIESASSNNNRDK